MATKQTAPQFLESKIKFVDYTAAVTGSLPKIPNTGDSLEYTVIGIGTGAALSLDHGATSVWALGSSGSGSTYPLHVRVINIGSSSFLVLIHWTGYTTVYTDTTNDYATTNVTTTFGTVQASGKHLIIGA